MPISPLVNTWCLLDGSDVPKDKFRQWAESLEAGVRDKLTANRNYYVATTGNDASDGLTAGTPFATLTKAAAVIAALDLSTFNVTVNVANGTYTAGFALSGRPPGTGTISLLGDITNPQNATISTASGSCVTASNGAQINVAGLKFVSPGFGLFAGNGSVIRLNGLCDFGACGSGHALVQNYSQLFCESVNYYVTGSAPYHVLALKSSIYRHTVSTVTLFGTPNFSTAYLFGKDAYFDLFGLTFSGAATGKRYDGTFNSLFEVYGAGTTFLPGNVAGTVSTQAQYL